MKTSGDLLKATIKMLVPSVFVMYLLSSSCAPRYGCYFSETDGQQSETMHQADVCIASEICVDSWPTDH